MSPLKPPKRSTIIGHGMRWEPKEIAIISDILKKNKAILKSKERRKHVDKRKNMWSEISKSLTEAFPQKPRSLKAIKVQTSKLPEYKPPETKKAKRSYKTIKPISASTTLVPVSETLPPVSSALVPASTTLTNVPTLRSAENNEISSTDVGDALLSRQFIGNQVKTEITLQEITSSSSDDRCHHRRRRQTVEAEFRPDSSRSTNGFNRGNEKRAMKVEIMNLEKEKLRLEIEKLQKESRLLDKMDLFYDRKIEKASKEIELLSKQNFANF